MQEGFPKYRSGILGMYIPLSLVCNHGFCSTSGIVIMTTKTILPECLPRVTSTANPWGKKATIGNVTSTITVIANEQQCLRGQAVEVRKTSQQAQKHI
jgi:hypothetical protein